MNFERYLTKTIQEAVREAIREELGDFKQEMLHTMEFKSQDRNKQEDETKPRNRIIRPKELAEMLSLSISTLYKMQSEDQLPPKIQISSSAVGCLRSDIEEWLIKRKGTNNQ